MFLGRWRCTAAVASTCSEGTSEMALSLLVPIVSRSAATPGPRVEWAKRSREPAAASITFSRTHSRIEA